MDRRTTRRILRASEISAWSAEADVVVVGAGAAGACACIEAAQAGARVLALESAPAGGGTSAVSAGQIYLGGGTPLQVSCGFADTPEEMFKYLMASSGPGAHEDKIRLYCDRSVEHYAWLVEHGVPFKHSYVPPSEAMNPPADDGLTYTGSELAHPYCDLAVPAPRGHNVQQKGDSGGTLMRALLSQVIRLGVPIQTETTVNALVVDDARRVVGVGALRSGAPEYIRAEAGVVLAAGGFQHNRDMVALHAPDFLRCLAIGPAENDGSGILLGHAAGGHPILMDATFVAIPYAKPRQLIKGILVDSLGRRYINEDVYQAVHGNVALRRQRGQVFLIVDAATFATPAFPIAIAASADSPEELEAKLGMPSGVLSATLHSYNENAAKSQDPLLHKASDWLASLVTPPFTAFDLRLESLPYPFFTLGGLHTRTTGEVLTPEATPIPGLFAAGRTTSGLCAHGYSSGVSLADATFFGRLAGRTAAAGRRLDASANQTTHRELRAPNTRGV